MIFTDDYDYDETVNDVQLEKDKTQDEKIEALQKALRNLNNEVLQLQSNIDSMNGKIDDKYAAQTQALTRNITEAVNTLQNELANKTTSALVVADNVQTKDETVTGTFDSQGTLTAKFIQTDRVNTPMVDAVCAEIDDLDAFQGYIHSLESTYLKVVSLTAQALQITGLTTESFNTQIAAIDNITALLAKISRLNADLITVSDVGTWHTPTAQPVNDELLKVSFPPYNGVVNVVSETGNINFSILNNTLVTFNQDEQIIYKVDFEKSQSFGHDEDVNYGNINKDSFVDDIDIYKYEKYYDTPPKKISFVVPDDTGFHDGLRFVFDFVNNTTQRFLVSWVTGELYTEYTNGPERMGLASDGSDQVTYYFPLGQIHVALDKIVIWLNKSSVDNGDTTYVKDFTETVYKEETVTSDEIVTNLYFTKAFNYKVIYLGDRTVDVSYSSIVDKTGVVQNITTRKGTVSATDITFGDGVGLSVKVVNALPEEGENNVIYTVRNDKSYFYDYENEKFEPMSLNIDIVNGYTNKGTISDDFIYPVTQLTADYTQAFPGTFYEVTNLMESSQIPEGTKLIYVDNKTLKFCPTLPPYSGTKFGIETSVRANKTWFDNIEWIGETVSGGGIKSYKCGDFTFTSDSYLKEIPLVFDYNTIKTITCTVDGVTYTVDYPGYQELVTITDNVVIGFTWDDDEWDKLVIACSGNYPVTITNLILNYDASKELIGHEKYIGTGYGQWVLEDSGLYKYEWDLTLDKIPDFIKVDFDSTLSTVPVSFEKVETVDNVTTYTNFTYESYTLTVKVIGGKTTIYCNSTNTPPYANDLFAYITGETTIPTTVQLADFEYTTPAITINDEAGHKAIAAPQKYYSYVSSKQYLTNNLIEQLCYKNRQEIQDFESKKGQPNGFASLDSEGHLPVEQLPTSALVYKGQWDASTGVYPTQTSYTIGDFYIVSVEGTVDTIKFYVGDWIIWNGTAWERSANANAVASVNNKTGAVVLSASDVGALPSSYTPPVTSVNGKTGALTLTLEDLGISII